MSFEIGQTVFFRRTQGRTLIVSIFYRFYLIFPPQDNLDEPGHLQKGKVVGLSGADVTVGWRDTDKVGKIKILNQSEVILIKQPFLQRVQKKCF